MPYIDLTRSNKIDRWTKKSFGLLRGHKIKAKTCTRTYWKCPGNRPNLYNIKVCS